MSRTRPAWASRLRAESFTFSAPPSASGGPSPPGAHPRRARKTLPHLHTAAVGQEGLVLDQAELMLGAEQVAQLGMGVAIGEVVPGGRSGVKVVEEDEGITVGRVQPVA